MPSGPGELLVFVLLVPAVSAHTVIAISNTSLESPAKKGPGRGILRNSVAIL